MRSLCRYIICKNEERFISEIDNNTKVGYKYFEFESNSHLYIKYRTTKDISKGTVFVYQGQELVGKADVDTAKEWQTKKIQINAKNGTYPLYLEYKGEGLIDFIEFGF